VPRSRGGLGELELALPGAYPILGASSTVIGRPAPGPRPWKFETQSLRLNLEEPLGIRKARQAMSTETAEPDTGRRRRPDRDSRRGGHDDLSSVRRRAHASRGVHGQADVPEIGQGRAATVDPDTDPHLG
jgi:hypothetical protein